MRRSVWGFLLLLCCMAQPSLSALAQPTITVSVDGQQLSFDQPPILQNDRTLVPMRGIFQALGAEVSWDEPSQTVTARSGSDVILFRVGQTALYKNGELIDTMPVPAQILNDRLLVPLRAVAQSMGAVVSWDETSYAVTILSAQLQPTVDGFSQEVKAADGTVVLTARLECDAISGVAGADAINRALSTEAYALGQAFVDRYREAALAEYERLGDAFLPYYIISSYERMGQTADAVSYYAVETSYSGGTEQRDYRSATYRLADGKQLSLSDLLPDSAAELEQLYTAAFGAMIAEEPKVFYTDAAQRLQEHLDEVGFYLTGDGVVCYLPPGVLAPVDAGVIAFRAEYDF